MATRTGMTALYREQGMGLGIPPGKRPAVLIIDMQNDFCDPDAPTTLWPSIRNTYEPIARLAAAAREHKFPVIYTQGLVAADGSSAGLWRFKQRFHAEMRVQIEGSRGAEIVRELTPQGGDTPRSSHWATPWLTSQACQLSRATNASNAPAWAEPGAIGTSDPC
jgi:isochorismatase family protein